MSSKFNLNLHSDPRVATRIVSENAKVERDKVQLGWLGRFFGNSENVRLYIVGMIALLIVFIAFVYTLMPTDWRSADFSIKELWTAITPILTTIIGYLIGSVTKKAESQ